MTDAVVGWKFRVETEKEMSALGQAFAAVAHIDKRPKNLHRDILHIGLRGALGAGKSVFASGFLSAFTHLSVEMARAYGRDQSLCETKEAGWIRHYDARLKPYVLPARVEHLLEARGWAGTDLAEHPDYDFGSYEDDAAPDGWPEDPVPCDYLVSLRAADRGGCRVVNVAFRSSMEKNAGFRAFLREAFALVEVRPVDQPGLGAATLLREQPYTMPYPAVAAPSHHPEVTRVYSQL